MSTQQQLKEVESELDKLDGYVSDTKLPTSFADEGVNKDFSNIIVINGLPVAPEAKQQKLLDFMKSKLFAPLQVTLADDAIFMPLNDGDATGRSTEGFCFVEFANKEDADKAALALDNVAFDKAHTLRVVKYDNFQEFKKMGDEFKAPAAVHYEARADMYNWLMDESCRDEFVIRYSNTERQGVSAEAEKHETEILWAEARGPPALDYGGEKQKAIGRYWTDKLVSWSPRGTYLTSLHPAGAKTWSGKGFREGLRLPHTGVNEVLWSPDEKYVATWNGHPSNPHPERAFIIWDAVTGQEIKAFRQRRVQDEKPEFAWSPDGKYLARINVDPATATELVAVYEAPTFALLDGRSIKAPGARDLSWCPKKLNLLAWWTPEKDNVPTSVSVMRIPSKEYVRQRQLFSVESCTFHWHPQGDYLAVVAEKLTKGQARKKKAEAKTGGIVDRKQTAGFTLEIMRLKDKAMAVDVLEVKDFVHTLAWEPMGNRFAILTGDGVIAHKLNITFYAVEAKGCAPLFTLEDRPCNALHWSPRGEFILLAGLESMQGALEFYDVEKRKTLGTATHDVANSIAWDPSGRIVATYKTQPVSGATLTRQTVGNGYILWTFQGGKVYSTEKPKMFQLTWRPRPDTLLNDEETKDVAKNLKRYISKYLQEDKERENRRVLLARLRKRKERDEFRGFLAERVHEWESNRELRIELGAEVTEEVAQIYEDVYEVFLGEAVTVVE